MPARHNRRPYGIRHGRRSPNRFRGRDDCGQRLGLLRERLNEEPDEALHGDGGRIGRGIAVRLGGAVVEDEGKLCVEIDQAGEEDDDVVADRQIEGFSVDDRQTNFNDNESASVTYGAKRGIGQRAQLIEEYRGAVGAGERELTLATGCVLLREGGHLTLSQRPIYVSGGNLIRSDRDCCSKVHRPIIDS